MKDFFDEPAPPIGPEPRLDIPSGARLDAIVTLVREARAVTDRVFDAIYPEPIRELSHRHWTPLAVARRAAEMLSLDGEKRVLDVGAGAGKFCLVAALTNPGHFVGIERRGHLVDLARTIAAQYGATNAEYVHGDMTDIDWREFDAFYLYNPFAENLFGVRERIDDTVEFSTERFEVDNAAAFQRLAQTRLGTRVVTYHGPRGAIPDTFELCDFEPCGTDVLELWIKERS